MYRSAILGRSDEGDEEKKFDDVLELHIRIHVNQNL